MHSDDIIRIISHCNTIGKSGNGENIVYAYDYENRLISLETLTSTVAYVYDADGIRVGQNVDGVTTDFVVDKNRDYAQVLEERDNFGSLTVQYVYGDDLISQERAGSVSYYHYDGLGSTRALTDDTEAVTDSYNYEAFGTLIHSTGSTANSYLFTGEQYDPNAGFYYLRARYYNPGVGRFMTTDSFEGKPFEPVSLHKYLYANMNPVMYIDPSGKVAMMDLMISMGVMTTLTTIATHSWLTTNGGEECLNAPCLMDDSIGCDEYGDKTYAGTELRCFCKCAGNYVWSVRVRGCLRCMEEKGVSTFKGHLKCYWAASDKGSGKDGEGMPTMTLWDCYVDCHKYL